jgi:hypothetical protein
MFCLFLSNQFGINTIACVAAYVRRFFHGVKSPE